jgi:hypothetical protein
MNTAPETPVTTARQAAAVAKDCRIKARQAMLRAKMNLPMRDYWLESSRNWTRMAEFWDWEASRLESEGRS